ncbi:hypothetical protein A2U01_0012827 [Trifolium medium]|uniref:Aspartic peptidase DDI1-type domain-containing protein n=1 Tax=Trifolium medium TaxID=97028 RepID=A0A392MWH2_9FABA|nr:hypothetical protein [Trifolium medium]
MRVSLEEAYDVFMGEIEDAREEVCFAAEFIKVLEEKRTPEKKQDPRSLTITCYIGEAVVKALCDIGSSVNVMPLSLAKTFNLKEPTEGTARELTLADQSTIYSKGDIEDIEVRITDLTFPADFMILDVEEDNEHPIILGRPFLATARAIIDMCEGKTWRIKIELQELEEEMGQLSLETGTIKEVPQDIEDKLKRLAIKVDIKALWVTTWGRSRKVAKRIKPQLGVNTSPLKKKPVKEEEHKKERVVGEAQGEDDKRTYPTQ